MSAEETELSFVRCGRCRSLVPAIATRCRMCGYVFAEGAKNAGTAAGTDDQSRVRQRTVSVDQDDRTEQRTAEPTSTNLSSSSSPAPTPTAPEEKKAHVRESWSMDEGEEDRGGVSLLQKAWQTSQPPVRPDVEARESEDDWDDAAEEDYESGEMGEEDQHEENHGSYSGPGERATSEEVSETRKRRRRRRRKRKGQMQVQPMESPSQPSAPAAYDNGPQTFRPREEAPQQMSTAPRSTPLVEQRGPVRDQAREEVRELSNRQPAVSPQYVRQPEEGARMKNENTQLVGWFVDFSRRSTGVAREIRSGQFFVAKTQLRPTDFVIDSDGISVPHCLIQAIDGRGLMVQDLMSETGTFVRRSGESAYVQCFEPVVVRHGDWLRFGSYELLVCTIPTKS